MCRGRAGHRPGPGSSTRRPVLSSTPACPSRLCGLSETAHSPLSEPSRARTWISGSRAVPSEALLRAPGGLQGRVKLRALVRTRNMWAQAGEVPLRFSTASSRTERLLLGHQAFANCSTYGPIGPHSSAHFLETRRLVWGKPSSAA